MAAQARVPRRPGGRRAPEEEKMEISVKKGDKVLNVQIGPSETMQQLKMMLYQMTEVPIRHQMLICLDRNKLLDGGDKFKLKDHGITAGASLYMGVYTGQKESTTFDHSCTCSLCTATRP